MRFNIQNLSKTYNVVYLQKENMKDILSLCKSNPLYYKYDPPMVSKDTILNDMHALPPLKSYEDKYYIGFYDEKELIAIMDLIHHYPDEESIWIGFFMVDAKYSNKGIGTKIIKETIDYLNKEYTYVRLAYVEENKQSEHFWFKNEFEPYEKIINNDKLIVKMFKKIS